MKIFGKKPKKEIRSSYIENDYGSILRSLILGHKPKRVIECGVLDGYSTFHIAHALRFNSFRGIYSEFTAYDLWEQYQYNHGDFPKVCSMLLDQHLLNKYVNIHYGDAFKVCDYFDDLSVDFLHMDISNDGEVVEKTIELWGSKISHGGIIAFEGGSEERDKVKWMIKYKKKPIHPVITNIGLGKIWKAQIFTKFPSMTLMFKR